MTKPEDVSASFRHIRLIAAREPGHPEGEVAIGYDLLVPLDGHARLDVADPNIAKAIVGSERVNHPSDPQLVSFARRYFQASDRMTR